MFQTCLGEAFLNEKVILKKSQCLIFSVPHKQVRGGDERARSAQGHPSPSLSVCQQERDRNGQITFSTRDPVLGGRLLLSGP